MAKKPGRTLHNHSPFTAGRRSYEQEEMQHPEVFLQSMLKPWTGRGGVSNPVSIATNGSRPTNRRNRAEMEVIRRTLYEVLQDDHPMTVRQVFYQLVGRGVIEKTEGEYKRTVVRLLTDMRRNREIPFAWIADNTRWMRKPTTHSSLRDMLEMSAETYRRAIWNDQSAYVEIWLEKEALAGVLYDETHEWDVPLMVTRGYPSVSYLYEAAETISEVDKPTYLYYFGDHDPSGCDITRAVERGIRELAPDAEIYFERVAVTKKQIRALHLPTRPTKKSDSRSRNFEGRSVELDAIPAARLRAMVKSCIEVHIDQEVLERTRQIEEAERDTLKRVQEHVPGW